MSDSSHTRTGRHCVFNMHVHLVFVTKYRKPIFTRPMLDRMRAIFASVAKDMGATLVEFDGEQDHVHLLIHYPPKCAVSKLVNALKGVSSRYLRREFPHLEPYYWKGKLWSPSYFAGSCGGAPVEIVKQYIQKQKTPY